MFMLFFIFFTSITFLHPRFYQLILNLKAKEERMFSDSYPPNWLKSLPCTNGHTHDATMFHLGSFLPSFGIVSSLHFSNNFGWKSG